MLIAFFDIDGVVHHEFVPPGETVNGHFYVQFLQRLRNALRRKRRNSGKESGFCITIRHRATHRLLCSNSSQRKSFLSSLTVLWQYSDSTLRISLRVTFGCSLHWNGPQGEAFRNHGGNQIKSDGRTPEDSKRSLPLVLPTMAGSMEQVCLCARVLLWRWLGKSCYMSYHFSAIPHFREIFDCSTYW